MNKIEQFCKEHPSVGDEDAFDTLLTAMAPPIKTKVEGEKT